MAPSSNVFFIVHYNGKCERNNVSGVYFESKVRKGFNVSPKCTFAYLKQRIEEKFKLGNNKVVSEIICRIPMFIGKSNILYESYKITDNDDVEFMFDIYKKYDVILSIELCVTIEDGNPSSNFFQPSSSSQYFHTPKTHYGPSSSQPMSIPTPSPNAAEQQNAATNTHPAATQPPRPRRYKTCGAGPNPRKKKQVQK